MLHAVRPHAGPSAGPSDGPPAGYGEDAGPMTLRVRLALAFIFVVLVPLLVGSVILGRLVPRALDDEARSGLAASRNSASLLVHQYCEQATAAAETLART